MSEYIEKKKILTTYIVALYRLKTQFVRNRNSFPFWKSWNRLLQKEFSAGAIDNAAQPESLVERSEWTPPAEGVSP